MDLVLWIWPEWRGVQNPENCVEVIFKYGSLPGCVRPSEWIAPPSPPLESEQTDVTMSKMEPPITSGRCRCRFEELKECDGEAEYKLYMLVYPNRDWHSTQ